LSGFYCCPTPGLLVSLGIGPSASATASRFTASPSQICACCEPALLGGWTVPAARMVWGPRAVTSSPFRNWPKLDEPGWVDCAVGVDPNCAHAPKHTIAKSAVTALGWNILAAANTNALPDFPLRQSSGSLTIMRRLLDGPNANRGQKQAKAG